MDWEFVKEIITYNNYEVLRFIAALAIPVGITIIYACESLKGTE